MSKHTFHKILILRGLSSNEDLNNIASPQFKAACWILYRLEEDLDVNDKFVQTYALVVFVFNILNVINDLKVLDGLLPNAVCHVPIFSCNDMQQVTNIDFGKFFRVNYVLPPAHQTDALSLNICIQLTRP